jgi:hypothetical protein
MPGFQGWTSADAGSGTPHSVRLQEPPAANWAELLCSLPYVWNVNAPESLACGVNLFVHPPVRWRIGVSRHRITLPKER